jgi:predicted dehydrogenase
LQNRAVLATTILNSPAKDSVISGMKTSLSRRRFIRNSLVTGVAAPFILPSGIWSAETKPNSRINLGCIGMGTQGRGLMAGFLRAADTRVIAVCDVDTTRREHARKMVDEDYTKQGKAEGGKECVGYNDFRELLARKDIDAVVIATPDHWHALIAIASAKAGKDIYCEKPLCQSIREARAMVNAVRKSNRIFQVGSMQRSSKEFRVACELVRNGVIGKIKNIEVGVGGPGVPCDLPAEADEPGLDWNMWLGPAPTRPYHSELSPRGVHKHFPNWRKYREYGGGMVTDWGAHHFDIAQWGMGKDDSGPVEIIPPEKRDATHGARFLYDNGVEVIHKSAGGVWFYGSDGKVFVDRGKFELWMGEEQKAKAASQAEEMASQYLSSNAVRLYKSSDHKSDWLNSVRTRKAPICDVEVGARTVSVCHLVNLAYYHGQRMKWDPKKEQFIEGTGDPKWLDVPHRSPWEIT